MRYEVGPAEKLAPGECQIVVLGGRSIGVFNVDGTYYALRNRCPHQGAPLAEGMVCSASTAPEPGHYVGDDMRPVVRCPWHGWEFDLRTGESWFDPAGTRVRSYEVSVERPQSPGFVETYPVVCEGGTIVVEV